MPAYKWELVRHLPPPDMDQIVKDSSTFHVQVYAMSLSSFSLHKALKRMRCVTEGPIREKWGVESLLVVQVSMRGSKYL